jgi:hypothetical protein
MVEKINPVGGNWETIAFILIREILVCNNPYFSRSELMSTEHLNFSVSLSSVMGHKDKPQHPENTLQRTIQNMRDKRFIIFHGNGEYELTKLGYDIMEKRAGRFPYRVLKDALDQTPEPQPA